VIAPAIHTPPRATRGKALVAMSGGVDSSVAAAMLVRDGWEVIGCFMRLGSPDGPEGGPTLRGGEGGAETCDRDDSEEAGSANDATRPRTMGAPIRPPRSGGPPVNPKANRQGCCSVGDAADARQVAAQLGIPLYVCNFSKDFGRIIDYFVDEYAAGRTPNP